MSEHIRPVIIKRPHPTPTSNGQILLKMQMSRNLVSVPAQYCPKSAMRGLVLVLPREFPNITRQAPNLKSNGRESTHCLHWIISTVREHRQLSRGSGRSVHLIWKLSKVPVIRSYDRKGGTEITNRRCFRQFSIKIAGIILKVSISSMRVSTE